MPHDCLQIKILTKQPRWPYFFKSLFCSRYNWAHYMQKWGTWYFLQHSYERKSVRCMEEKISRWKSAILGEGGFPISGIANLLQSHPNSIAFWDYARYLQKTSFKMHHLLRSKVGTPHKDRQLEKKVFFLFFQPRTYHQAKNWELGISFWNLIQPPFKVISLWCLLFNKQRMYDLNKTFVKISMYLLAFWAIVLIFIGLINYWDVWPVMIALVIPIKLL